MNDCLMRRLWRFTTLVVGPLQVELTICRQLPMQWHGCAVMMNYFQLIEQPLTMVQQLTSSQPISLKIEILNHLLIDLNLSLIHI